MDDPALDSNGEDFPNVYTGQPALIKDMPEYVTTQQEEAAALGSRTQAYPVVRPYNRGILQQGRVRSGHAAPSGPEQHNDLPKGRLRCGLGLLHQRQPSNHQIRGTESDDAESHPSIPRASIAAATTANQILANVQPTAVTLYHELFHLVLGNPPTYPDIGEIYNVLLGSPHIVGLAYDDAIMNPESFALAAVAYDYTLNWPADSAGARIEFYAGYTTQG